MMKLSLLASAFVAASISLFPLKAQAVDINNGATVKVDAHGTCRQVSNNSGSKLYVPTKESYEWSNGSNSFLSNIRTQPGVSVQNCPQPQLLAATDFQHRACAMVNRHSFARASGKAPRNSVQWYDFDCGMVVSKYWNERINANGPWYRVDNTFYEPGDKPQNYLSSRPARPRSSNELQMSNGFLSQASADDFCLRHATNGPGYYLVGSVNYNIVENNYWTKPHFVIAMAVKCTMR